MIEEGDEHVKPRFSSECGGQVRFDSGKRCAKVDILESQTKT